MIANYHTHTPRCFHATGDEEAYVESAIVRGLKILGFSDHAPQWFPGKYYSTMRMFPDQLGEYCDTVRALKEKYQPKLQIHLGVEAEFYPGIFDPLLRHLKDAGVEYMILGQHWVGNEKNEPYVGAPTQDEALLKRYCDQSIEGMQTGLFSYMAHPDIIRFTGERHIYEKHMRRLCHAAIDTQTPLEINLLGIRARRNYPSETFWKLVGEEGCPVVLGIDAHSPEEVLDPVPEQKAMLLVEQYKLKLLETVPLKKL